tara:strand:- start:7452 stop:8918 length:1467 start_codon:yes stop_codon:yes gene_type:complete
MINNIKVKIPKYFIFVLVLGFILGQNVVYSQVTPQSLTIQTEAFLKYGKGDIPFWMWANNRGKVYKNSSSLNLDILYNIDEKEFGIFNVRGGIGISTSASNESTFNLAQIYSVLRYKKLELSLGRFFLNQGLNSNELGLGPFINSRNASALPGIELRTDNYLVVPFTQGYLKYKISLGHFWFENDRQVRNAWLHNKQFYLQIDFDWLKLNGGIIHNVMWGGNSASVGDLPSAFSDYLRVFFAQGAQSNSKLEGEVLTALGNNLAGYDFGINLIGREYKFDVSRLFYIEDKNAAEFRSVWDGQWSMSLVFRNNRFLKNIAYDHIYTIRQDAYKSQPGGRANYFNHHIYKTGWTYQGNIIGNPLLTYDQELGEITNNMIVGHTISIDVQVSSKMKFIPSFAYTRNYGKCKNLVSPEGLGCGGKEEKPLDINFVDRETVRKDYYYLMGFFEYSPKKNQNIILFSSLGYDFKEEERNNIAVSFGFKFYPIKN